MGRAIHLGDLPDAPKQLHNKGEPLAAACVRLQPHRQRAHILCKQRILALLVVAVVRRRRDAHEAYHLEQANKLALTTGARYTDLGSLQITHCAVHDD